MCVWVGGTLEMFGYLGDPENIINGSTHRGGSSLPGEHSHLHSHSACATGKPTEEGVQSGSVHDLEQCLAPWSRLGGAGVP